MGNSLRCCLACVLPCGALDVVRVVHLSGHVEQYSRHVSAGEIMAANPNHVLSTPSCAQGVVRHILIVSPESELRRGGIYFLIPASTLPEQRKARKRKAPAPAPAKSSSAAAPVLPSPPQKLDNYLTDQSLPRKIAQHRLRLRSGSRVGLWRPHLDSICED